MKHTISVLVENKFGVLARIAGLFSARGFNIESLTVGETEDSTVSKMTIVVKGDDRVLDQVKKQLGKLIDTISVKDLKKGDYIDRELVLFKMSFKDKEKAKIATLLKKAGAVVVHAKAKSFLVQMAGPQDKVLTLLKQMEPYKIKDLTRTGKIAIGKE